MLAKINTQINVVNNLFIKVWKFYIIKYISGGTDAIYKDIKKSRDSLLIKLHIVLQRPVIEKQFIEWLEVTCFVYTDMFLHVNTVLDFNPIFDIY